MSDSKRARLQALIEEGAPGAWACLSRTGRQAVYPAGIPEQARQARDCRIRATIGQVTGGKGEVMAPAALSASLSDLPEEQCFLYSAQGGMPELRRAWRDWQDRGQAGWRDLPLPLVTAGLTQGLCSLAHLLVDPGDVVLLPSPTWGNYRGMFELLRGGRLVSWESFDEQRRFTLEPLREQLRAVEGQRACLVLNFPGNPSGFTPSAEQLSELVELILAHPSPLSVICDDAYAGMLWEDSVRESSVFTQLAERGDPQRLLPLKVDGATKELLFFGGRVGFISVGVRGEAGAALEDKLKMINRGLASAMPGPSQGAVLKALQHREQLEEQIRSIHEVLRGRYHTLRDALSPLRDHPLLFPYPFNSGCFALVGVHPELSADRLRRHLIDRYSVGLVALGGVNALRIAYCSTEEEDLPPLVEAMIQASQDLSS